MSQSHTGRNGLIVESIQTEKQRTKFNNTMDVSGQNTVNLQKMFASSPIHIADDGDRADAFSGTGNRDPDSYNKSGNPYTDFAAFRDDSVRSGFGFEGITVAMDYSSGKPDINNEGIATPGNNQENRDVHDGTNSLMGHPNLRVNKFSTEDYTHGTDVQVARNNDLPGTDVENNRSDTLGEYFTGAGLRSP